MCNRISCWHQFCQHLSCRDTCRTWNVAESGDLCHFNCRFRNIPLPENVYHTLASRSTNKGGAVLVVGNYDRTCFRNISEAWRINVGSCTSKSKQKTARRFFRHGVGMDVELREPASHTTVSSDTAPPSDHP